jgi:hypothetical protein
MPVSNKIAALHSKLTEATIDRDAAIEELRSLVSSVDDPYQREKLEDALNWARIYFGAQDDLDRWGSSDTVRAHLQASLYKALLARKPRHDLS